MEINKGYTEVLPIYSETFDSNYFTFRMQALQEQLKVYQSVRYLFLVALSIIYRSRFQI